MLARHVAYSEGLCLVFGGAGLGTRIDALEIARGSLRAALATWCPAMESLRSAAAGEARGMLHAELASLYDAIDRGVVPSYRGGLASPCQVGSVEGVFALAHACGVATADERARADVRARERPLFQAARELRAIIDEAVPRASACAHLSVKEDDEAR